MYSYKQTPRTVMSVGTQRAAGLTAGVPDNLSKLVPKFPEGVGSNVSVDPSKPEFDGKLREERDAFNRNESSRRRNGEDVVVAVDRTSCTHDFYETLLCKIEKLPMSRNIQPDWTWVGNLFVPASSDMAHLGIPTPGATIEPSPETHGPIRMEHQDPAVIGVVGSYDQQMATEIVTAIDRAVRCLVHPFVGSATDKGARRLTHPFAGQPSYKPTVYFVFNTCGGDVSCLEQILDAMDSNRDKLRYVGVVSGHEHSHSVCASCGCMQLMACDYVIVDEMAQAMMHEVHFEQFRGVVAPTPDKREVLAEKSLRLLTDRMYDAAEISVLSRLVGEEHSCAVACALREGTDFVYDGKTFTPEMLRLYLRQQYYKRYQLELLHHAMQHIDSQNPKDDVLEKIQNFCTPANEDGCPNVWKFVTEQVYKDTSRLWLHPDEMIRLGMCDLVGKVETSQQFLHVFKPAHLFPTGVVKLDDTR